MAYINGNEILFSSRIGINGEGGESATLITKEITENGTYNATDEGADGYSNIAVNVPMPTIIEAPLPITENGTYTAQMVGADGISKITVNVEGSGGGGTTTNSKAYKCSKAAVFTNLNWITTSATNNT